MTRVERSDEAAPRVSCEVRVREVTYRRGEDGDWPARIYQPQGPGPFPALVDVHGGVWCHGSHTENEPIDRSLAAGGLVVVAIACRQAPDHPYPSQVADVHYAVRWLKARAREFSAAPNVVGALGTSSGAHAVLLSAMRPSDPRYAALPLPGSEQEDAKPSFVLAAWPILDPYARYLYAKESGRPALVEGTEAYFRSEEAMREGNPQLVLERGEPVELPPTLILQGTADENVPLSISRRFARAYRKAGGLAELVFFPGMPHGFAKKPGPESDRALQLMKAFVAERLPGGVGPLDATHT